MRGAQSPSSAPPCGFRFALSGSLFRIHEAVHQEAEAIGADDEAARGVAHVYAFIFVGALVEWVSEGMQRDIDEVIDDLRTTLDGSFAHSLANWKLRNDRGGKEKR